MSPSIYQNNCHVMFSALFIIVYTVIVLLVQNVDSIELKDVTDIDNPHMEIPLNIAFFQSKRPSIGKFVSNKNDVYNGGLLMENVDKKVYKRTIKRESTRDPTLDQLKHALSKFLVSKDKPMQKRELSASTGQRIRKARKAKLHNDNSSKTKWHKWTKWSSCSVTCGKGREIRWRHCRDNCQNIETEMEEKACQLPACPRKLFGIIKL